MPRQLSCRDMCKFMTWLNNWMDKYRMIFHKILIMSWYFPLWNGSTVPRSLRHAEAAAARVPRPVSATGTTPRPAVDHTPARNGFHHYNQVATNSPEEKLGHVVVRIICDSQKSSLTLAKSRLPITYFCCQNKCHTYFHQQAPWKISKQFAN